MAKVVYVIPGFHGSVKMKRYQRIIKKFKTSGFRVVPIKITWNYKVMSDYVAEFLGQLVHNNDDEVYVFGFSFGAMIAFITADKIKPIKLILGSLSPFFKEDLPYLKKSWKRYIGKKRMEDLKNFAFNDLIRKNHQHKTSFLVGEMEDEAVRRRVNKAHKKFKKAKLIIVKGAKHDVSDDNYRKEIFKVITCLKN